MPPTQTDTVLETRPGGSRAPGCPLPGSSWTHRGASEPTRVRALRACGDRWVPGHSGGAVSALPRCQADALTARNCSRRPKGLPRPAPPPPGGGNQGRARPPGTGDAHAGEGRAGTSRITSLLRRRPASVGWCCSCTRWWSRLSPLCGPSPQGRGSGPPRWPPCSACAAPPCWPRHGPGPPRALPSVHVAGVVPTLCCAIAFHARGMTSPAYTAVIGAPLAWSAVLLDGVSTAAACSPGWPAAFGWAPPAGGSPTAWPTPWCSGSSRRWWVGWCRAGPCATAGRGCAASPATSTTSNW